MTATALDPPPGSPAAVARRNRVVGFAAALAIALLATHWPKLEFGSVDSPVDKLAHAIGYGGMTALCLLAFPRRSPWLVALSMAGLGVVDELTQAIPGLNRTCDAADWAADLIGIAVALEAVFLFNVLNSMSGKLSRELALLVDELLELIEVHRTHGQR